MLTIFKSRIINITLRWPLGLPSVYLKSTIPISSTFTFIVSGRQVVGQFQKVGIFIKK